MREKLVYIVTTERISHNGDGGSIGSVWSYNAYYAKMYAAAFMAQDSSIYEYTSTICQYDPNNNYDPDIIPANNPKNMLKIVTNCIGEQFILTENIENNAYNAGAFKLIQNKYLDAFGDYFNKNGAGALFATVHSVITLLRPVLKNKLLVECMGGNN